MTALVMLAVFSVYLAISIAVVRWVVRWAKKRGRRPLLWGILTGMVMYNLVFWDLIPTYVVYKYYCITKAGFWVYKTPEQWKAENPGVAETLTWREMSPDYKTPGVINGYRLNERFVWEERRTSAPLISLSIFTESVIDIDNNETMIKRVNVGVGYPKGLFISSLKLFKWRDPYIPNIKEFGSIKSNFKQLGRKVK